MHNRKVLVYSYFPVRAGHWAGGAQAFLATLLPSLLERGMQFRILSPRPEREERLFHHEGVVNLPVLDEAAELALKLDARAKNLSFIREHLEWADVIWTIDEAFPLKVRQPVVSSLQTADGPEENQSILAFNWDIVVTASHFLLNCVRELAGSEMWEGNSNPEIKRIFNGIDLDRFRDVDSRALRVRLALPDNRRYIVFPHRPEPGKGMDSALEIMRILKIKEPEFLLLVPTNPVCVNSVRPKQVNYYAELETRIQAEDLADMVYLHDWIAPEDMPAYLALGEWCLVMSRLPEGFCFVPVQALACGTPVLSTKCGALRDLFPAVGYGIRYFEPNEPEVVVSALLEPMSHVEMKQGRDHIERNYSLVNCADQYFAVLSEAVPKRAMSRGGAYSRIRKTPWWYVSQRRVDGGICVWHDLKMCFVEVPPNAASILQALASGPMAVTLFPLAEANWLIAQTLLTRC